MADEEQVTLLSSDNETFTVSKKVADMSNTIKDIIEEAPGQKVPLPNVPGKILSKVIEYCKFHVDNSRDANKPSSSQGVKSDEEVKTWDADFMKIDQSTLFEVILAANYMNIEALLDLACATVANMIKGKTPEEIRKTFNIVNDFTPEEEEEVRRENQWAFE